MKRKTILIIDSKKYVGSSWKKGLSQHYKIVILRDADVIKKLYWYEVPRAVIINSRLHNKFDLTIFRRIKELLPLVPIFAVISYRCSWSSEELKKLGIERIVKKPFPFRILEEKIEEVLSEQHINCRV